MSFLTSASKFPRWCYSFPLFVSSTPLRKERRLWAEYSGLLQDHPHPHVNTHTTPGGRTNKAIPSPINLTFSSVPEPASKPSYLGERSKPRERARSREGPRKGLSPAPAFASPLACLSRVYFSRYPTNVELARRLSVPLHRARKFEKEKKLRSNEPHLFSFNFSNSQNKEFSLNFSQ